MSIGFIPSDLPEENMYIGSPNDMYKNVLGSTLHNSQILETTQMPLNRRLDIKVVVY